MMHLMFLIFVGKASAGFVDGIENAAMNIFEPLEWDLYTLIIFGIFCAVGLVVYLLVKKWRKKCKKNRKKAKKHHHEPLVRKESRHHYSLHHDTPLHHVAFSSNHGPYQNAGYINPNAYPYIPPPTYS